MKQVANLKEYVNTKVNKKQSDLISRLKEAEKEIENGDGIESDEAFRKLRQKYGY